MGKLSLALMALLFLTLPAAADFSANAELSWNAASDAPSTTGHIGAQARLELEWRGQLGDRLSPVVSGRIGGEQFDRLRPGRADLASYDGPSRPLSLGSHGIAEIRDAYVDVRFDSGQLRIGKQQIVWGELDGIKVLDVLNPASFERFILDDFDESRISLWSAWLDLSLADWRIELALIPDATVHDIPRAPGWFAPTAPRYRYGATQASPELAISQRGAVEREGTVAARVSRFVAGWDVQFVASTGLDFEPLAEVEVVSGSAQLATYHRRRTVLGFALAGGVGPFVLRTEVAYSPGRHFSSRLESTASNSLAETEADQWRGALAVEMNAPAGVFVNAQLLVDHVSNASDGLVRPETDRIVTLAARRSFNYETVVAELRAYRSLTDDDQLLRAKLRWSLGDRTALVLAAEQFSGTRAGTFGQFSGRDLVQVGVEVSL
ncbi:MAG: OprO/OprP family phosphate-selective porin [Pseudomonadaceae bacterium]|nr:OprO/OprP family phosphate-selective porin [Pseudomonadaceae bacterium]